MKVVKNGKEKTFYAQCNKCASELEYTFEDVQFTKHDTIYELEKKIVCPICGEEVYVSMLTKGEWEKFNSIPRGYPYAYGCSV